MKEPTLVALLLLVSIAGASCSPTPHISVIDAENARQLTHHAYGLAMLGSDDRVTVTPLDGSPVVVYNLPDKPYGFARVSSDGRKILQNMETGIKVVDIASDNGWSYACPPIKYWDLSRDGRKIAAFTASHFYPGRIVFLRLEDRPGVPATIEISSQPAAETLAWSPDGESIVYGADGRIEVYSLVSRHKMLIGAGHNPTWSGDGAWIAYASIDHEPVFYRVVDKRELRPFKNRKIQWSLHFSPDSSYVFFSEKSWATLIFNPGRMSQFRIVICDVPGFKELASLPTEGSPEGAITDMWYDWICLDRKIRFATEPS